MGPVTGNVKIEAEMLPIDGVLSMAEMHWQVRRYVSQTSNPSARTKLSGAPRQSFFAPLTSAK